MDVEDEECNMSSISPLQGQKTFLSDNYGQSGQVDSENDSSDDDMETTRKTTMNNKLMMKTMDRLPTSQEFKRRAIF